MRTLAQRTPSWSAMIIPAMGLVLWLLPGCASDPVQGYALTTSHPTNVQSISVDLFDNQTFTAGVEADLADALIKELQRATPYRVISSGTAQSSITGTITSARMLFLTPSRQTGLAEEIAVDLVVSFEWRDARTGDPLVERIGFRALETFVPARPSNERLELGRHAAVQEMARAIVAELRSTW